MKKNVTKYYGINKRKRIINMVIAVLAIIAILIILITIYGRNVGNFVVTVEAQTQVSLSLSEYEDFREASSRLTADGLRDQTHATLSDIPDNITETNGSHNDIEDKRYFAYTFYCKNTSSVVLDYSVDIVINKSTKGVESALRVMVIKNDITNIYAKTKEYPESEIGKPEDHIGTGIEIPYTTIPFASSVTIMSQTETNFIKNAINKYTVVMWLEGWDNECVDAIKGGTIKMDMKFKATY